ncbi:class I SAM-dependent methyltransferase [Paenibacillus sp. GCM10027627]|uniref:class I SAM-dependent methyltransferase n=1 Tax=unclassified Paenibacillus TaxID=185978 RepID=UPI003634BC95
MPNHDEIYNKEALGYDELIAAQPSLLPVINDIREAAGLDIVDMGAGTGRLTNVLAPVAKSIMATDAAEAMLKVTGERLRSAGYSHWGTMTADHRKLPLEDGCADLVVSGWSICYLCTSDNEKWKDHLAEVMGEIDRILRSGGTAILFETMGTGWESPHPPDFLVPYYEALVQDYGFAHRWIRLDYHFESVEQAERLTRFFFGDELADRVAKEGIRHVPECAGVWWLHKDK